MTDLKVQRDIERGPFGLPRSITRKIPERDKVQTTGHEQTTGEASESHEIVSPTKDKEAEDKNSPTSHDGQYRRRDNANYTSI